MDSLLLTQLPKNVCCKWHLSNSPWWQVTPTWMYRALVQNVEKVSRQDSIPAAKAYNATHQPTLPGEIIFPFQNCTFCFYLFLYEQMKENRSDAMQKLKQAQFAVYLKCQILREIILRTYLNPDSREFRFDSYAWHWIEIILCHSIILKEIYQVILSPFLLH